MSCVEDKIFFGYLNKILDRQFADLYKSLKAKADILCLVGCMHLIEFLGGIRNGKLGERDKPKCRFHDGINLLGGIGAEESGSELYVKSGKSVTVGLGKKVMWTLRNALVHEYTAKLPGYGILILSGSGFTYMTNPEALRPSSISALGEIKIGKLLCDLKYAREKLIMELKNDRAMKCKAKEQLLKLAKFKDNLSE